MPRKKKKKKRKRHAQEKLYSLYDGPRHLSMIPIKDSHLFKIIESVFSFYLKLHNF